MSMTSRAHWLARLEHIATVTGHASSWLSLLLVVTSMLVVVLRYAFDIGSIGLQELVMYLHAALFMLGLAYTLSLDEHVRVDIFYQRFSPARRGMVDFFGTLLFLLPTCITILVLSASYVWASWIRQEGSADPGGLPFVYGLKTLLLIAPALLTLQGIAEAMRAWLRWRHPEQHAADTARPPLHSGESA
jgi:TRAP-type mannitol/chloroaromatic compound transport system permease small subunit